MQTLELIPRADQVIEALSTTSGICKKALQSALEFHSQGEERLSIARVTRVEKVLRVQNEYLDELVKLLAELHASCTLDGTPRKNKNKNKAWDKLDDEWWLEHANQLCTILRDVHQIANTVATYFTQRGRQGEGGDATYEQLISERNALIDDLVDKHWKKRLRAYIDDWKDLALVIYYS